MDILYRTSKTLCRLVSFCHYKSRGLVRKFTNIIFLEKIHLIANDCNIIKINGGDL